jgi:phosphate-selective porin
LKHRGVVTALAAVFALTSHSLAWTEEGAGPLPTKPEQLEDQQSEQSDLEGLFKNAFIWATPDGKNELRLGAAAHLDARAFFGDSVAPNSFDMRRARLDVRARVHGWMTMRIQAALEGNPYIRNAWLDLRHSDGLHLRLGQMKVPFSTEWLTRDNQVNFLERGSSAPVYPFFDRGLLLWGRLAGGSLTYNVGVYTGAGIDVDAGRGDIDDHKDIAVRLFAQPFRASSSSALEGLFVAVEGTYGASSVPTRRYELRGLAAANYESQVWRWRTEQVIGTNGRAADTITGEIDSRRRWGAELLYVRGPFSASFEWLELEYDNISIYHDYWVGSERVEHQPVLNHDGGVRSVSAWLSVFLTGEGKNVSNFGWTQPDPSHPFALADGSWGAWELLARFSTTVTDGELFETARVQGFTAAELPQGSVAVGEGGSVTASVLKGASTVHEATLGLNWTLNHNFRIQLNLSTIWAPDWIEGTNGIVSGGSSNLADRTVKSTLVETEHSVGLRFIFRI